MTIESIDGRNLQVSTFTRAENCRKNRYFGERNGLAKLNDEKVAEIHRRWRAGERQSDIALSLGVSRPTVCNVVSGRTWAHRHPRILRCSR